MSRTKNSAMNLATGVLSQVLLLALGLITRRVFLLALGKEFLGVNTLFSNIISMLSVAELGVGTTIVYHLYKPIAEGDRRHITLLVKFYRTAYRAIGVVIALLGLALLPFLSRIVKDAPESLNMYAIYGLYLLQAVASYLFFAYKSSLIRAHQKEYVINNIASVATILMNIVQIALMMIFHSFMLYVSVTVLFTIGQNVAIALANDAMYPFTKDRTGERLQKSEMIEILKDCYSFAMYRINQVILNATDSIILSSFMGTAVVAVYGNYMLISSNLKNMLNLVNKAIVASLGNLHASDVGLDTEVAIFKSVNFISFFINGVAATCLFVVANPFITWWLGEGFTLSPFFVALICFDLYLLGIQRCTAIFRNSMGLFQQAKYRPLIGSALNIVLSLIFVYYWGITGVILGTVISSITTYSWFDPLVLFKHGFRRSPAAYYRTNLLYMGIAFASCAGAYVLVGLLPFTGLAMILAAAFIAVAVSGALYCALFARTPEFRYLLATAGRLLGRFRRAG